MNDGGPVYELLKAATCTCTPYLLARISAQPSLLGPILLVAALFSPEIAGRMLSCIIIRLELSND